MDIRVQGLSKSFGEKRVLQGFSVTFPGHSRTCIMGASGCGKTTLLYLLMGLETPDAGEITGVPPQISVLFQEDRLCEDFTPMANLRMVLGKQVRSEVLRAHLSAVGLENCLRQPVRTLSGGQKRRVALVRAMLYPGELVCFDEPFQGLDAETRKLSVEYVREELHGRTLIAVTHDPRDAEDLQAVILQMPAIENPMA